MLVAADAQAAKDENVGDVPGDLHTFAV